MNKAKWPVMYVKDAKDIRQLVEWAHDGGGGLVGWMSAPSETVVAHLVAAFPMGADFFIPFAEHPMINHLHHPGGLRHPRLTPVNSFAHMKAYLAKVRHGQA